MTDITNIRNFAIVSHVDHGKSTLSDRMLEVTSTVEKRKMKDQLLDRMDLERERGITIQMTPVTMKYRTHLNRGHTQTEARNDAEGGLLYEDITYKVRGAIFAVRKSLGLGHKESVYHRALMAEFEKRGLRFQNGPVLPVIHSGKEVGRYNPDFLVEDKIIFELKALPEIGKPQQEQVWSYLKGSDYKLALLVNFGSTDVEIKRIVYDSAREASSPRYSASGPRESAGVSNQVEEYTLNLIDTPGHIDFSYEVSRALKAAEGVILLVDATQGIQAQTLSVLTQAREFGLVVIPALSKVDAQAARVDDMKIHVAELLGCDPEDVLETSGKTGQGVAELLETVIAKVPPPTTGDGLSRNSASRPVAPAGSETAQGLGLRESVNAFRALVFDFEYSAHKGAVLYVKVWDGTLKKGEKMRFAQSGKAFTALEVGTFSPDPTPRAGLSVGEVGYVATGIKEAGVATVGDTVVSPRDPLPALAGYKEPKPVVWASVYPESQDDFALLKQALERLNLEDPSFSFEEEASGITSLRRGSGGQVGRGFRCGFLGMLHLEIITERLRREFELALIVAQPSITYEVEYGNGERDVIYSPSLFPDHGNYEHVYEPWAKAEIITPRKFMGDIMQLLHNHEAAAGESKTFSDDEILLEANMPLRELMRGFFDELKSASAGFASLSYELMPNKEADVTRLDVMVAGEPVPAFTRVVSKRQVEEEAKKAVEKLHSILPRQLFEVKIQGRALGRIVSSKTLPALRKDVTAKLYGGDVTRKKKLLEKQKKGKKKMRGRGKVNIPPDVFLKMMR